MPRINRFFDFLALASLASVSSRIDRHRPVSAAFSPIIARQRVPNFKVGLEWASNVKIRAYFYKTESDGLI